MFEAYFIQRQYLLAKFSFFGVKGILMPDVANYV